MNIKLSLLALQDLQRISSYTLEKWGVEQEELYLNRIYDLFEEIVADPEKWRFRHKLYSNAQSALCQKHIVFFQQQEETLLIGRVLHQQMDHKSHLSSESFKE